MAEALLNKLKAAVKGLTYQSESDEPWDVIHWQDASDKCDLKKAPGLGKGRGGKPLKAVPLDEFFADLIKEESWHGATEKKRVKQYRELKATVEALLAKPQVLRSGEVEVVILIVGKAGAEDWFALKTKAVET